MRFQDVRMPLATLVAGVILAFGCSTEELAPGQEVPPETKTQLEALGFSTSQITTFEELDPLLGKRSGYLVEGDLKFTDEMLEAMVADAAQAQIQGEQYFHGTLVTGTPRTLKVLGYTGTGAALTGNAPTALQQAVAQYNALGLTLRFNLSFGVDTAAADIVVYNSIYGSGIGFPSGGDPHKWIAIYLGSSNPPVADIEYVMIHEMGHAIGMRHTDWMDPSPCGYRPSINPYHIPGTPTGIDPNSIFRACVIASNPPQFSYYDEVALHYLY